MEKEKGTKQLSSAIVLAAYCVLCTSYFTNFMPLAYWITCERFSR